MNGSNEAPPPTTITLIKTNNIAPTIPRNRPVACGPIGSGGNTSTATGGMVKT
jgi:hypothetical protein